ncbi:MAG: DNA mismatch repair endonuclease MutL [Bacteroidaceae bacterium]|nr:DNA mismatch repair endonuclease MutL [Bacteroidaceae bacterium]
MGDIIHLLPDSVANQIAAGEVIQRPSSVVKELMENAIDAGASHIQIYITDAGKSCIQVIDNGQGMSETDARLAFERHATSKISQASDLYALRTMGFRGEALPSIAAVAQIELKTRTAENELGIHLTIENSHIADQNVISCPVGANFIVNNIFYNVPARRKFLKSNQTELNNILIEFEKIALANPKIAFTFYNNKSLLLSLPEGNFKQRILNIFGKKYDTQLLPVNVETPIIKVSGFIGTPESSKKKGAHQFFFVNGRYIRHPYFAKAIQSAYERLIPENEQAPFFLSLEVDPSHIDINIHPTKAEVKFQDEQPIWQILLAAAKEALGKFNAIPTIDFNTENRPQFPVFSDNSPVKTPTIKINSQYNPFKTTKAGTASFAPTDSSKTKQTYSQTSNCDFDILQSTEQKTNKETTPSQVLYSNLPTEEQSEWEKEEVDYIQYKGRYIVTPVKSGLLLIDYHRAHIRVLYDLYLEYLQTKKGVGQGLLFPQLLQLPPSSIGYFEQLLPDLQTLGFDITNLGNGSYSISSIPAGTEGINMVELIQNMVAETQAGAQNQAKKEIFYIIAHSLAKKIAMPVGIELSKKEMSDLIEKLFTSTSPNYTPDGKTILVILEHQNIHKLFS